MTLISIDPFKGASRAGVEEIRNALKGAHHASLAAITETMKNNNETVADVFHPSERAAEIDWVNLRKSRNDARSSAILVPFLGATSIVATSFVAWALVPLLERALGAPQSNPPLAGLLISASLIAAVITGSSFKELLKEYRLGFTSWFTKSMRFRFSSAWATGKESVYVARLSRAEEELIEVAKVPFTEIQACSYSVVDGVAFTHLFTKAGLCYTLAEPSGSTISGPTKLANHIWSLTQVDVQHELPLYPQA